MKYERYDARPGNLVCVERYGGIYEHYGIYMGNGNVIHRTNNGVQGSTLDEFCKDSPHYFVEPSSDPEKTARRAVSRFGEEGYDLVSNNCEHFARWCQEGVENSVQVDNLKTGATLAGVGALIGIGAAILDDIFGGKV
jgi:hypothetical protein